MNSLAGIIAGLLQAILGLFGFAHITASAPAPQLTNADNQTFLGGQLVTEKMNEDKLNAAPACISISVLESVTVPTTFTCKIGDDIGDAQIVTAIDKDGITIDRYSIMTPGYEVSSLPPETKHVSISANPTLTDECWHRVSLYSTDSSAQTFTVRVEQDNSGCSQ